LNGIVRDDHRKRWSEGAWTDDTYQMMCILNSLIDEGELNITSIAQNFLNWFNDALMGIGNTVYKVLNMPQYVTNPHKAAHIVWKLGGKKAAANGAVMRTSVLGCYQFDDKDKVVQNAVDVCRLTHHDPRCVASCIVVSLIICNYINRIDNWELIKQDIVKY
jgi:ADP-ribosylglycohydrolase